ncbi:ParA family protein [Aquimarina mytili]|uniref:ParA family protein n=1 Tax=Aquimarina mytili TaxID=874423 RepID=A0A937D7Y1_9FLAO|nr:ParA family protein [Aquimarina mytili]MBL0686034.1 ParA family protein [Aquimarina mytili]
MVTLTQVNQKGGVGKTTNTIHIGAELASRGNRVLLIDADQQCDLTRGTGTTESTYDLLNFLNQDPGFRLKQRSTNLFVLPGSEEFFASRYQRFALKEAITNSCTNKDGGTFYLKDHFDIIFIDVPPQGLDPEVTTPAELALLASDYFATCLFADVYAVENLEKILSKIKRLKDEYHPSLKMAGIYFGNVLSTRRSFKKYWRDVENNAPGLLYKTFIRQDAQIVEAADVGKTIFQYQPNSRSSEDYTLLVDDILKSINND